MKAVIKTSSLIKVLKSKYFLIPASIVAVTVASIIAARQADIPGIELEAAVTDETEEN